MLTQFCLVILAVTIYALPSPAFAQVNVDSGPPAFPASTTPEKETGDRIIGVRRNFTEWVPAALPRETYRVCPGDVLSVKVDGKANLDYHVHQVSPDQVVRVQENSDEVTVSPGGDIYLPLVGSVSVAGKTVVEIEQIIRSGLSEYIKSFRVSTTVARVRSINVWVSGEVENPGSQILPAVSTVSLLALQSRIKPTGSTRCITLVRGSERRTVDLYKMMVTGDIDSDVPLEPGDRVYIPAVTRYIEIDGEVVRPGRYEMAAFLGGSDSFCIRDTLNLALGALPSASLDNAFVERAGDGGLKQAIKVDLRGGDACAGALLALQPGDKIVVPSISAFQPMIRLIGEFKGDGVYQRAIGPDKIEVQNKTGIYFLKQGQTVLDVISATGGVTPQADLKRARIERTENGKTDIVPVDLERLLVKSDKSADVVLINGDSLVLPAIADKIHVFGEVTNPGSYTYSPNRRLIDYLGNAGGPTTKAKLTEVRVVRGTMDAAHALKLNAQRAMSGKSMKGNPVLEPGDIVYVPSKLIGDWRDGLQLVFTAFSLNNLLRR